MSKNVHIVAVETASPDFNGYKACDPFTAIEADVWIGPRPVLEELDSDVHIRNGKVVLQAIPYIVVEHNNEVLAYVRPTKGNEKRLHGRVSIGVGGHVDLEDVVSANSVIDLRETLGQSAAREIEEEIGLLINADRLDWTGLIMRRDGSVDRVHLGYVAKLVITNNERAAIIETQETGKIRFLPLGNIFSEMVDYEIEAWTKAILEN